MILDTIVRHKRAMLAGNGPHVNTELLRKQGVGPTADFAAALKQDSLAVIAEIKRTSPSAGRMNTQINPAQTASLYQQHGAAAVSVLTDTKFFGGTADDLIRVKAASDLPVLRKDFIVSEYQIYESKSIGADAILLIVRILSDPELSSFLSLAADLQLHTLVEVHSAAELKRAVAHGAGIIGINNRDLDTLKIDMRTSLELAGLLPASVVKVSESGIKTREDMLRLQAAGFDAVLVGQRLMQSSQPGITLQQLTGQL